MAALYLANVAVLLIAGWAVWERRLTFGSRWDTPITYGIVLFGAGAALDSPWPGVAAASFPLTGKYYLLTAFGHFCYLWGAAMGMKATYMRLMDDDEIRTFMRNRIAPLVLSASVVMLICLICSPVTSTMPADHLYLVRPDGWLSVYWVAFLGTLGAMEVISIYGWIRLRNDPRSVMVGPLIVAQMLATLSTAAVGYGILSDRTEISRIFVWPFAYAAIAGGAIAAVISWRYRVAALISPAD